MDAKRKNYFNWRKNKRPKSFFIDNKQTVIKKQYLETSSIFRTSYRHKFLCPTIIIRSVGIGRIKMHSNNHKLRSRIIEQYNNCSALESKKISL